MGECSSLLRFSQRSEALHPIEEDTRVFSQLYRKVADARLERHGLHAAKYSKVL